MRISEVSMNANLLKMKEPALELGPIHLPVSPLKVPKISRAIKHHGALFASLALALTISYPTIKRLAKKIVYGFLILDAALLAFNLFRIYRPLTLAERTHMAVYLGTQAPARDAHLAKPTGLGKAEEALTAKFQNEGLSVSVVRSGTRDGISAPEHTLAVGGDTVFTYEYKNAEVAATEAKLLADGYTTKAKPGLWDSRAHIYVKDTLVMFYLGTSGTMLASLEGYAGDSLVNQPKADKESLAVAH